MTKQNVPSDWTSSTRGDRAWKEETDRVATRNAEARKAGRIEREAYERQRDEARHVADAERRAKLMKKKARPKPG